MGFEQLGGNQRLALLASSLGGSEELAQVAVALAVLDQHQQPPAREREVGAYQRAHAALFCLLVEARRAVKPIAVGERQRRVAELRRPRHQVLRQGRAPQKRKRALTSQLDVRHCLAISYQLSAISYQLRAQDWSEAESCLIHNN